jgi:preprotein translocase subunit SecD
LAERNDSRKFRIEFMKKLSLLIAACLVWSAAFVAGASVPPVFQMRLIVDASSGESESMTVITRNADGPWTNVFNVEKTVLLDQTAVKSAKADQDVRGNQVISIDLTVAGARQFAEVTRQNIGKRLAIIINGQLCEAPMIMAVISDAKVQISGSFSKQDTKDLVGKINGALSKE